MHKPTQKITKWVIGMTIFVLFLFFVLPNLFNFRERDAFSDETRFRKAQEKYNIHRLNDSIVVKAGPYYKRSQFHSHLFGEKYRELWDTQVKVPVFDITAMKGGLKGKELGGGMQTIGIDLANSNGRSYDLRSVNKDQSKALPGWLQYSFARPMFRDQVAALNPYAAMVVASLADAAGILHTNPQLVFVPYNPYMEEKYNKAMAGRLAIIEESPDESWVNTPEFNYASKIMDTDEMFEEASKKGIPIDTTQYLKCRLFDILISDWDRHEGQWEWALVEKNGRDFFEPIPKDRDMALYKFNEGYLSFLALAINPKFQSFTRKYENVEALTRNSSALDKSILGRVAEQAQFVAVAKEIRAALTNAVIEDAFNHYPSKIFDEVGEEHIAIMKSRRESLPEAAAAFYEAIRE